jgi:putative endonuclease
VTSDLLRRVWDHLSGLVEGFTERKQIKRWRRAWKIDLIEESNPRWRNLRPTIIGGEEMESRFRGNDKLGERE